MTRELAGNFARLPIRLSCRHSHSIISIHRDPERSHRIERSVVHFYGPGSRIWLERRTAMVGEQPVVRRILRTVLPALGWRQRLRVMAQ
jgi:hypothetical protein